MKTYCNKCITMGHGDFARCGQPYWGKIYMCDKCKVKNMTLISFIKQKIFK